MLRLESLSLTPLPLGAVHPRGWLKNQLRLQADGLSGHLDDFWPDVKDSRWIGGNSEAWERFPYWLDGVIPLAFLLEDEPLMGKVTRYVEHIITNQGEDGWLGSREMVPYAGGSALARYDLWAQFLVLKALIQFYEATQDPRIPMVVEKSLRGIDYSIDLIPLYDWGKFRWFEVLIPLFWLFERSQASWLLDLAVKLHAQGFHWGEFFSRWPLTEPTPYGRWNFAGHVVNNAMAVKAHGLWGRLTSSQQDRQAVYDMIEKLDRYHGMVTGVFTGDECLAGKSPTQGTELCAVVEYAYSLEVLLSTLGDPAFGDRLERIIFNALPATFSPDMWAHQYDQQVNQVECSIKERSWNSNGLEANIFGLEPNYGCCTANLSQGWPKFSASLWMGLPEGGLAAVAYAPCAVHTNVNGVPISVEMETDYPFNEEIRILIYTTQPVNFPLLLRIPAWADGASVQLTNSEITYQPEPGTFYCLEHCWEGKQEILLRFPMQPVLWRGKNSSASLIRGPLIYALKLGERWKQVNQELPNRQAPHADWEVYPITTWNYALAVSEKTLGQDVIFENRPVGSQPFSPEGAPVIARLKGHKVPEWGMQNNSAGDVPTSPVKSLEPTEDLELIPYGCTNVRITEFPIQKEE
jgi:hypothetical protein